uniref:Uncharacterized protein n=2 Tax=Meloidogyne incognita group TaxID=654580 RepID=A0A915LHE7_MELJA
MDVNLHSNELEARFRLRLFTFLRSQEDLKQLISNDPTNSTQSSTIKYSQLRLELGQLEEQWIDENKEENNLNLNNNHWQLGQILSEDCSPKLAIYLLLREERILEAISFVDHFNDSRAILLLRFLAEKIYRLQLLSDFCQNLLIKQFLERILFLENLDNAQTLTNNQEIIKYIQQNIEVALNIDVLFPSNLHNYIGFFDCLIAECAYHMGAEFEKLLEDFSFGNELICSSDNIKLLQSFYDNNSRLSPALILFLLVPMVTLLMLWFFDVMLWMLWLMLWLLFNALVAVILLICCCKKKRMDDKLPSKKATPIEPFEQTCRGVEVPDSDEEIFRRSKKKIFIEPKDKSRQKLDDPAYKTWKGLEDIFVQSAITKEEEKEKSLGNNENKGQNDENKGQNNENNNNSTYCSDVLVKAADEGLGIVAPNYNFEEHPPISRQESGIEITLPDYNDIEDDQPVRGYIYGIVYEQSEANKDPKED